MSNYDECIEINKAALERQKLELNDRWDTECKRAAASGRFPEGVRLELETPPPREYVEKWSSKKYEAYVSHFKGLESNYRHFEDAVPECWTVRLRERPTGPGQPSAPTEGLVRIRSLFRWPLFRASK